MNSWKPSSGRYDLLNFRLKKELPGFHTLSGLGIAATSEIRFMCRTARVGPVRFQLEWPAR